MSHIFISYSKKNKSYTDKLVDYLEKAGFHIWYDGRIDFGTSWEREIVKAIEACTAFIVVMTPESYESEWVSNECQHASELGKPQFPILLAGDVFFRYKSKQYVDVRGEVLPPESFLQRLAAYSERHQQQGKNLADSENRLGKGHVSPSEQHLLIERLNNLTTQPSERATIGLRLAEIGDPRTGIGLDETELPDFAWIKIPAGSFLFGSNRKKDKHAKDHEPDQREYSLPTFHLAQYPVTYAQYEVFVQDKGYENPLYWTQAGWQWKGNKKHPENYWQYPKWHLSNYPVIGVTWYEATAFCRWFSSKCGLEVRLPTETEFEKAARGTTDWIYPYGDGFEATRINTSEANLKHTSAVGVFPQGASPYGVMDLAGNVWEWSLSLWSTPYQHMTSDTIEWDGFAPRVIRGGSWYRNNDAARISSRSYFSPLGAEYDIGFRVCCEGNPMP